MSLQYQAVGWNRQKGIYDLTLATGAILYLCTFLGLNALIHPTATVETLLIRALGTLALLLLHVILVIGPLCRISPRFLPLLYNRRHLGVTMFVLALAHGVFSLIQFHALGDVNPLVSLLVSNTRYGSVAQFPFQMLGALALMILFLLAATSHDFWLHNLTPVVWKRLHMSVYVAYVLLVAHVTWGALQSETSPMLAGLLGLGFVAVVTLHLIAGCIETRKDRAETQASAAGFIAAIDFDQIVEGRGKTVVLNGERIAVFRHEGKPFALSNVCRHQNGPLGEGKIIDGCVTCPWHGYQFRPDTGESPPPFHDKVSAFSTKLVDGKVWVNPCPL